MTECRQRFEKAREEKYKRSKKNSVVQSFRFTKMLNEKSGVTTPPEVYGHFSKSTSQNISNSENLFFLSKYGQYLGDNISNCKDYVEVLRQKRQIRGETSPEPRQAPYPIQTR